jgi:murein DD-endopeptidase MepM/ murein hydrolase activator NlpD
MYVRRGRGFGRYRGFGQLTSPISGDPTISSLFGPRAQPVAGASTNHQGIDYAVPIGTPVLAAGQGTVTFAGTQSGFGNTVMIDNGGGVTTLYGHLSSINVSVGQTVSDGDQIAQSGNTGTTSGPNLHFGVFQNGVPIDPTMSLAPVVDYSSIDALLPDVTATDTPATFVSSIDSDFSGLTDSTDSGTVNPALIVSGVLLGALGLWVATS